MTPRAGTQNRHHIVELSLLLIATPYLGLRLYLVTVMHAEATIATHPNAWLLVALVFVGSVQPGVGVVLILRRLFKDRLQFHLLALLEAYIAVIFIFASGYAVLQSSSFETSFAGMPVLWALNEPAVLDMHVGRLHDIFFESLYLSITTITTVGYGDLAPLSKLAKSLTAVEGMAGIGFMGIALGNYFSVCVRRSA